MRENTPRVSKSEVKHVCAGCKEVIIIHHGTKLLAEKDRKGKFMGHLFHDEICSTLRPKDHWTNKRVKISFTKKFIDYMYNSYNDPELRKQFGVKSTKKR